MDFTQPPEGMQCTYKDSYEGRQIRAAQKLADTLKQIMDEEGIPRWVLSFDVCMTEAPTPQYSQHDKKLSRGSAHRSPDREYGLFSDQQDGMYDGHRACHSVLTSTAQYPRSPCVFTGPGVSSTKKQWHSKSVKDAVTKGTAVLASQGVTLGTT